MAKQDTEEINPTNALLQNLLKRPDVRSTLILSRKDGSIIKAAGLIAQEPNGLPTETSKANTGRPDERTEEPEASDRTRTDVEPEAGKSHAQILASSIFHFVASATALSASLSKASHFSNATPSGNNSNEDDELAKDSTPAGGDVQLLRLRLSKQEVIIFPDPGYLCCVVQDIDKSSRKQRINDGNGFQRLKIHCSHVATPGSVEGDKRNDLAFLHLLPNAPECVAVGRTYKCYELPDDLLPAPLNLNYHNPASLIHIVLVCEGLRRVNCSRWSVELQMKKLKQQSEEYLGRTCDLEFRLSAPILRYFRAVGMRLPISLQSGPEYETLVTFKKKKHRSYRSPRPC